MNRISEFESHYIISIEKRKVTKFVLGYSFFMDVESGDYNISFQLSAPVHLVRGEESLTIDPYALSELAPLLERFEKEVSKAVISKSGVLEVYFSDDVILRSYPEDTFEAWQITDTDDFIFVCMPGGQVAKWSPQNS